MASTIEDIIDEIMEYIDSCKPSAFSSSKIIVNRDDIDNLFDPCVIQILIQILDVPFRTVVILVSFRQINHLASVLPETPVGFRSPLLPGIIVIMNQDDFIELFQPFKLRACPLHVAVAHRD